MVIGKLFDEVQFGLDQLGGDDDVDQYVDYVLNYCYDCELVYDLVVVSCLFLYVYFYF